MHNQLDKMKFSYNQKERDLEWTYKHKINKLENENNYLKNVIDRFKDTIHIFIHWVCKKFDIKNNDRLDIYVENGVISLVKDDKKCIFCSSTKDLTEHNNKHICNKCMQKLLKKFMII